MRGMSDARPHKAGARVQPFACSASTRRRVCLEREWVREHVPGFPKHGPRGVSQDGVRP